MYWIYILLLEDRRVVVNGTSRLIKKLNDYVEENCRESESEIETISLAGMYRLDNNVDYYYSLGRNFEYTDIINMITENMMKIYGEESWKVEGGKYNKRCGCKDYINCDECWYNFKNVSSEVEETTEGVTFDEMNKFTERPMCECGIPCEINLSQKSKWYWSCSMKSNNWLDNNFNLQIDDINQGCNFFRDT